MTRILKAVFPAIGVVVVAGWLLGKVGIGNFVLAYTFAPIQCTVYDRTD